MTVWQNISTITGSTRAPFAVRASIGFVFWLLASAFCFGQGYSYTSTYVWISDGEVYATSTTDSNYGSGSHDAWASTRISSPSGRSVTVDTGFTGQYASAWTHLSTQDEIGDFVAEGGHQEWCYIAQALITLSITRQVIKNPTCPIPTGEITQAGSWEDVPANPACSTGTKRCKVVCLRAGPSWSKTLAAAPILATRRLADSLEWSNLWRLLDCQSGQRHGGRMRSVGHWTPSSITGELARPLVAQYSTNSC